MGKKPRNISGVQIRFLARRRCKALLYVCLIILVISFASKSNSSKNVINVAQSVISFRPFTTLTSFTLNWSAINEYETIVTDTLTNDWEAFINFSVPSNVSNGKHVVNNVSMIETSNRTMSVKHMVDCHPDIEPNQHRCEHRRCLWSAGNGRGVPMCLSNPEVIRYALKDKLVTENSTDYQLSLSHTTGIGKDSQNVRVSLTEIRDNVVRLHILDPNETRREAPMSLETNYTRGYDKPTRLSKTNVLTLSKEHFEVSVNLGQLIFSDILVQTVVCFPSQSIVYGYDTNVPSLKIGHNWRYYFPYRSSFKKLSGDLHAFFVVVLPNGYAGGIYLHNSNFMRIMSQPGPCLSFVTLGGNHDFYLIALSKFPQSVIHTYWELVGLPLFPDPANMFYDSRTDNIRVMGATLNGTDLSNVYKIMSDTWEDALAVNVDVRVRDKLGKPFVCSVNQFDTNSTLVDFSDMSTFKFWGTFIRFMCGVDAQCAWQLLLIDAPQCFNICNKVKIRLPINIPERLVGDDTMCITGRLKKGVFHNLLNAYPYLQAHHSFYGYIDYLRRKPNLASGTTYAGQGRFSGHFKLIRTLEEETLRQLLVRFMASNMYGMPLFGTNICGGILHSTDDDLCARLIHLAAWFPLMRQVSFFDKTTSTLGHQSALALRKVLPFRNELIPYLYSLFYHAIYYGGMIVRQVFAAFPTDKKIRSFVDSQFMWGALMVTPHLIKCSNCDKKEIMVYLPKGAWYNWYTGQQIISNGSSIKAVSEDYQSAVYCQGGSIVALSTHNETPPAVGRFGIAICPDEKGFAWGQLFRDLGNRVTGVPEFDYAHYTFSIWRNTITITCARGPNLDFDDKLVFIRMMGIQKKASVFLEKRQLSTKQEKMWLLIHNFELKLHDRSYIQIKQ